MPEELLDLYRQNPANVGNHYRYMSREATKLQVSEATPAVSSKGVAVVVNAGRGAVKSDTRLPGEAVPSPALRKESVQARSDLIAATSAPAIQGRDSTTFIYRPAPIEAMDLRVIARQGLVRLHLDERGNVTAVNVVQSTGHRQFDADACATFRRWRAKPGLPREVEMPITAVIGGTRTPIRVPTSAGSMTSG